MLTRTYTIKADGTSTLSIVCSECASHVAPVFCRTCGESVCQSCHRGTHN